MVSFNQLNIVIGITVAFFTNYVILELGDSTAAWAQEMEFRPLELALDAGLGNTSRCTLLFCAFCGT